MSAIQDERQPREAQCGQRFFEFAEIRPVHVHWDLQLSNFQISEIWYLDFLLNFIQTHKVKSR